MAKPLYRFDKSELSGYLSDHVGAVGTVMEIEKFDDGQSNPTYRLETTRGRFVLRAKPPGKLLKSAHAIDREFRVMQALWGSGVPVPKVHHLAPPGNPIGPEFYLMEFVEGRIFWNPATSELDKTSRAALYSEMANTLAKLHGINPASVGLGDFGKPGNYFARQIARWSENYRASALAPLPDAEWLMDWFADNMLADDGAVSIVHGDYRLDNMIFAADSPSIAALLDWELSTLGHPMADIAYQCMQLRMPPSAMLPGLRGLDRRELGIPTEQEYLEAYCAARGVVVPAEWNFYLGFAYFRLLAILQGVVRRAHDGSASNPTAVKAMERAIPMLASEARMILS